MEQLFDELCKIFSEVQANTGCHQRCTQVLSRVYDRADFELFLECFCRFLKIVIYKWEITDKSPYYERIMQFTVNFTMKLAHKYAEDETNDDCHPLLSGVINQVLKFHNVEDVRKRYNSCKFITTILDAVGESTTLNNELCDVIQDAMLQATTDPKPFIRVMAVQALVRLQMPDQEKCPVIAAFVNMINDPNHTVRSIVVEKIAPLHVTIPLIVKRVQDVSEKVRASVYKKCSLIPPCYMKIVERQMVCFAGFDEPCKISKRVFLDVMLPKWVTSYEGNFLNFLNAIRLDADEKDVENTARLSKLIMEELFRTQPIENIISYLPIGDDKLVPTSKLLPEIVLYWGILQEHIVNKGDLDEILEKIVPDLQPFCNYIERYMNEKELEQLEMWQLLEYQFILLNLFNMAGRFDLCEEVGKQRLHELVVTTLTYKKLQSNLVEALVVILEKTVFGNIEQLAEHIYEIFSTRETEIVEEPSKDVLHYWNFKLAQLKVKLNIVDEELEDAKIARDFKLAAVKEEELKELRRQLEALVAEKPMPTKVKHAMSEEQHGRQCLDILIAVLHHPKVYRLTPTLCTLKEELTKLFSPPPDMEVLRKLHRIIALACIIDRKCAQENVRLICTPVASYKLMAEYDQEILIISVNTLIDMMQLYGLTIFGKQDDVCITDSTTGSRHQNHRKLYNPTEVSTDLVDIQSIEFLVESIVLMLDAESQELCDCASSAIAQLLYHGIMVSADLLTDIQLRLYNPLMGNKNPRMFELFSKAMVHFACSINGSSNIIEESIIPTLTAIGNAPKTSPLAEINFDELIKFLRVLTSSEINHSVVDSHKSLAYSLCSQISKNLHSKCVTIWLKMLVLLNPPKDDKIALKELKAQALLILKEIKERVPKDRLKKYVSILDSALNEVATSPAQIPERINENVEITFNPQTTAANVQPSKKIQIISNVRVDKQKVLRQSSMSSLDSSENGFGGSVQVIADVHVPATRLRTARAAKEAEANSQKSSGSTSKASETRDSEKNETDSVDSDLSLRKSKGGKKGRKQKKERPSKRGRITS